MLIHCNFSYSPPCACIYVLYKTSTIYMCIINVWLCASLCVTVMQRFIDEVRFLNDEDSQSSKFHLPCNKEERLVLNSFFGEYNPYFKKL